MLVMDEGILMFPMNGLSHGYMVLDNALAILISQGLSYCHKMDQGFWMVDALPETWTPTTEEENRHKNCACLVAINIPMAGAAS
jgi:hypothetical protein